MKYRISFGAAALISLFSLAPLIAASNQLEPLLKPRIKDILQPFAGAVNFTAAAAYAQPCTVKASLTALRRVEQSETFSLVKSTSMTLSPQPDSIVWSAPIDSGTTRELVFVFTPEQVGTFQFAFTRRTKKGWQALATVTLALDEDGKLLYHGASSDYRQRQIPAHPKRDVLPIRLAFPRKSPKPQDRSDRAFLAEFELSKPPRKGDTTTVKFKVDANSGVYDRVQFLLEHSTNVQPVKMPSSWGDSVAYGADRNCIAGDFTFTQSRNGLAMLDFKVAGNRRTDSTAVRVTTDFTIYFVTSSDGELLFIGDFDPYVSFREKSDAALGSAAGLMEVTSRDFRTRQVSSQPDYVGEALRAKAEADSVASMKQKQ